MQRIIDENILMFKMYNSKLFGPLMNIFKNAKKQKTKNSNNSKKSPLDKIASHRRWWDSHVKQMESGIGEYCIEVLY
jgi:hypothetical protein